ncbi:MAG: nlhH 7 [Marmoricola sp.]|nr:nlhH 7 [Marmoricola sp.]
MLFPDVRRLVSQRAGRTKVYDEGFDIAAARRTARELASIRSREAVGEVLDLDADGVPVRVFRPLVPSFDRRAVILDLQGAGFVFHDLEVRDPLARALANRSGLAVVSVGYRQAPEHRFPAAQDDLETVLDWIERSGSSHGLGGALLLHGDGAGANLALTAALRHPARFGALVLVCPFLDPSARFDSYRTELGGDGLREAAWYWAQYADQDQLGHPDIAPLGASGLWSLPRTLVVTAEHDPLRAEGEHLVRLAAEQGASIVSTRYQGQIHGFWDQPETAAAGRALVAQVAGFLSTPA